MNDPGSRSAKIRFWRFLAAINALFALSACGGSGDAPAPSTVATPPPASNQPPVANAGADQTVASGATVTLNGSASSDPDGSVASFQWIQTSGAGVALSAASSAQASFTAPNVSASSTLTFSLTVTDNSGATAIVQIAVTITPAASGTFSVSSVSPADNAGDVAVGAPLTVMFSAPVDPATVTAATIALTVPESASAVAGAFDVDAAGTTAKFRPDHDLKPNLDYRLTISGVRSSVGDVLASPVSINFSTQKVAWHAGAYVLFAIGQVPTSTARALTSAGAPDIGGVALRFFWRQFEDDFGNYDFSALDDSLRVVAAAGKKASILIAFSNSDREPLPALGQPSQVFYSIDLNPNHAQTFGKCVVQPSPFDENYRSRFFAMVQAMGDHLRADPSLNDTVAYITGSGDFTTQNWAYGSNLQQVYDDVACTQAASWTSLGFSADAMIAVLKESVDAFMEAFPDKPQWFSVGQLDFGAPLSCGLNTCVATSVADWGVARYPDRFGVWREDLNANRNAPASNTLWNEIAKYRPRIGAQMVFSSTDCPGDGVGQDCRLASPGVQPADALTSAIEVGSSNDQIEGHGYYLMPYQEIYNSDVADNALAAVFSDATTRIQWKSDSSAPSQPNALSGTSQMTDEVSLTWAASSDLWDKENSYTDGLVPAPTRKSQTSVIYRVWRDGSLIGTSDTTSFVDANVAAASAKYAISAVDAAGNESPRTSELIIQVQ